VRAEVSRGQPSLARNFWVPNNRRRKNRRGGRNGGGKGGTKQLTCRASGHEASYSIGTIVGTGGVLNANAGVLSPTDTGGRYTIVLPDSIGPRCSQLARLYNEWKINSLVFKFVPNSYQIGTQSLTAITQYSLVGYGGFTLDPTIGLLIQSEIVEAGGKEFNYARPASFKLNGSKWLYTSPRLGDTLSDNRFISPGIFNMQIGTAGPETSILFGQLEAFWDISFRYPIDADSETDNRVELPHGSDLLFLLQRNRENLESHDEKKEFVRVGKPNPNPFKPK